MTIGPKTLESSRIQNKLDKARYQRDCLARKNKVFKELVVKLAGMVVSSLMTIRSIDDDEYFAENESSLRSKLSSIHFTLTDGWTVEEKRQAGFAKKRRRQERKKAKSAQVNNGVKLI